MKIALIGATGNVGQRVIAEATRRGHSVTAIARNVADAAPVDGVTFVAGDVSKPDELAPLLAGHDAVIVSVQFRTLDFDDVLAAVRGSGVSRMLVVGGAASLEVTPGVVLLDTPDFPDFIKPEATPARAVLVQLRGETEIDWTFLSPSMFFGPGERTGNFRLEKDALLTDAAGKSHISYEDYAVALLDEVETPKHSRTRFTVGY
jgi:putative NADH-flavin reductase